VWRLNVINNMPLKVVQIRFEDPPVPFDAGSEILSYVAYPLDREKRAGFASALCRFGHGYQQLRRDPQWAFTPHLIRPQSFEPLGEIDASELYPGMELFLRRLTTAHSILLPFLSLAYKIEKKLRKVGDLKATVDNICQRLIEQEGGDAASNLSNFKTRRWSPTRPVAHLAFALFMEVYHARLNKVSNQRKYIWEILFPLPSDLKLQETLWSAEHIRIRLPSLAQVRFKEEETIMFVPSGSGTLQVGEG
jgi:hypothetical protein